MKNPIWLKKGTGLRRIRPCYKKFLMAWPQQTKNVFLAQKCEIKVIV